MMHRILVIRLHFPLNALHVSNYISPSSGATFISSTSHSVYAGICRYHTFGCWCGYSHTNSQTYGTGIYKMRCTAYKVAPDDGLIQSETCRASNGKWSPITRILCIMLVRIHIEMNCVCRIECNARWWIERM